MSVAGQEEDPEVNVTEGGETVTVPPPDDDEPEAPAAEPGQAAAPERPNHKERKANRMREANEARERAEREASEARGERERLAREVAELRGFVSAQAQRQQQPDPQAELNAKVAQIRQQARNHLERSAAAQRAADRATAEREMNSYHEKVEEAVMERVTARMEPEFDRRMEEVRGNIPSTEILAIRENLGRDFGWLYTDAEARAMTDAKIAELMSKGRPAGLETFREACAYTAKRLNLGGRQAPTQQNRQRLQAVPGGEGGGAEDGSFSLVMDRANKTLAHKMYKHLEPKEAEREFVKYMAGAKRRGEF